MSDFKHFHICYILVDIQGSVKPKVLIWFQINVYMWKKMVTHILYDCQVPSILQIINKIKWTKKISTNKFKTNLVSDCLIFFSRFIPNFRFSWKNKIIDFSRFYLKYIEMCRLFSNRSHNTIYITRGYRPKNHD